MAREYPTQCWSCLGEFDASAAVWCACSARSATKLCPFCFQCFCQADIEYQDSFWRDAPDELKEERDILKEAAGSVGETLIRSNMLNTDQLVAALRWQQNRGGTLPDALVDLGFVSRDNLDLVTQGKAADGASTVDLSHGLVDASLVTTIGVELCYRKRILPISKEEIGGRDVLTLAMAGPTDVDTIDQVQSLSNCRVIPMIAPERELLARLTDLFPAETAALAAAERSDSGVSLTAGAGAPRARRESKPAPPPPAVEAPAPAPPPRRRRTDKTQPPASPVKLPAAASRPAPRGSHGAASAARVVASAAAPAAVPAKAAPAPAPAESEDGAALLQKILGEAIAKRASSIQFEIKGAASSLFFRIDGHLFRARTAAPAGPDGLRAAFAARAGLTEGSQPASGRFSVKAGERRIEVVVRRLPSGGGESLLAKIVDPAEYVRPLEGLGTSALDTERIRTGLTQPRGLIVLSGPPHNGVDSTRLSLMAHLGRDKRRVLAVESPQFLVIDGVRQAEIPFPPAGSEARKALEDAHGAEIVFVPEIQSTDLASLALTWAAQCLVVVSIQARRASQAPGALLWHQVEPGALAAQLKLIVNQRLVRRICAGCRAATQASDRVLKMMGLTPDEAMDLQVFQGAGCDGCALGPGYSGRVALFEVMEGTPEIAVLIATKEPAGALEREARRVGMSPLRAACLAAVGQGITTLEEFQKGNF